MAARTQKTIEWDPDHRPFPKKGQKLRDGHWDLWKVIKVEKAGSTRMVTLDPITEVKHGSTTEA